MSKSILVLLFIFLGCNGFGQIRDSILLYNGQILIGEIRGIKLGEITIDDIDLKMINVKLYKIKILKTLRRYKIETSDNALYYGLMRPSPLNGRVKISPEGQTDTTMAITGLNIVVPLEKSFFSSLTGNLSLGFSYAKSGELGQMNLSSGIQYTAKKFEYQLSASENASIDSSVFSRDREEVDLLAAYNITQTTFIAASVSYQRNLELSIARRLQEMIGAGNKIFVRSKWQLYGITGLTFNQEQSTTGENSNLLIEVPLIFRFNFFQFQHPNIQINSSQSLYVSLSQKGRVRYDGNTTFSWELIRYFYLTLNPYSNFDSRPPAGNSKFDFGIVFSVSYKF